MVESDATWAAAEKDCNDKGGHLASIHSADENRFIGNLYSGSNSVWIGGTDVAVEVGFTI
jgi:neurocan core protein